VTSLRIEVFPTPERLTEAAGKEVLGVIARAIGERGICALALSGGETPRMLYRRLAETADGDEPDWSRVHLCFGDERMVSPDDAASNYGMVRDELIAHIPLPAGNVHRIRGERPPAIAAREYAADIAGVLSRTGGKFDLVLLGLGTDGHTASLFPGTDVLDERAEAVRAVVASVGPRVTLTLPVINGAREVLFLVSGEAKASIVRRVLEPAAGEPPLPASLVRPVASAPCWMLDAAAAGSLTHSG